MQRAGVMQAVRGIKLKLPSVCKQVSDTCKSSETLHSAPTGEAEFVARVCAMYHASTKRWCCWNSEAMSLPAPKRTAPPLMEDSTSPSAHGGCSTLSAMTCIHRRAIPNRRPVWGPCSRSSSCEEPISQSKFAELICGIEAGQICGIRRVSKPRKLHVAQEGDAELQASVGVMPAGR